MKNFYTFLLYGVFIPLCCFSAWGCSNEQGVQKLLGTTAEGPVFLGIKSLSDREIKFDFSSPVKVASLRFEPELALKAEKDQGHKSQVMVNLDKPTRDGERVMADILVEDARGNTLGVLTPFRARNNRVPGLLITELRTKNDKKSKIAKAEFVEIKALSDGNLGGVKIFIASMGLKEPVFEFEPEEIKKGEYLVLHLRTYAGNLTMEETAKDYRLEEDKKRLKDKTDIVALMDQDGQIIDGVMFTGGPGNQWPKGDYQKLADMLAGQGAWPSSRTEDAASGINLSATRTLCRDETKANTRSAADWYVSDGKASPGRKNDPARYKPKPPKTPRGSRKKY